MHFTKITAALAVATLSQALVIPPEITEDGVYAVKTLEDGTELHTKIADTTKRDGAATSAVDGRDVLKRSSQGQIWCGCGFNMDPTNCDGAVNDLKNQMDAWIGPYLSFYSIRTNVVAFACNRGSENVYADAATYGTALGHITDACGRYIAGAEDLIGGDSSFIVGYARYANGDDFCGDSTSSSANHC